MHRTGKHVQIRLKNISFLRQRLILIFISFGIYFRKILSRSRRGLLRAGALCCSPGWGSRFGCPHLVSGLTCCTPGLVLEGSQSLLISADQYLVPEVCAFQSRANPWGSCRAALVTFPAQQQNCSGSSAFQEFLREKSWAQRRLLSFGSSLVLKFSLDIENGSICIWEMGVPCIMSVLFEILICRATPTPACLKCELSLCWTAIHSAALWPFLAPILLTAHTGFSAFIDIKVQLARECNGLLLVWVLWIENVCLSSRLGANISQSKPFSSKPTLLQKSDKLLQAWHKLV